MSFLELAKKRYSVRKFKSNVVEEDKLNLILEAARIAPSAANHQPLYFVVIREEEIKKKVAATYSREWLLAAPVIIVVCGDHSKSWRRADGKDHCDIDAAIAIDHMTLAAVEQGLGTCWVCAFNSMDCSKVLELPSHVEAIALLPLGYPANEPDVNRHATRRKQQEEMTHWDGYRK